MQKNTILFIVLFFICGTALPQRYPFVQYTPKDGLVYNRCRFLVQDQRGLLYIATYGGLSIYDGSSFTNYTTREGLASNFIEDIIEMGRDSLWIISGNADIQYLKNGRIHQLTSIEGYKPSLNKMIRLQDGKLYALADEGLFLFERNRFVKIELHNNTAGKAAPGYFSAAVEAGNKLYLLIDPGSQAIVGAGQIVVYDFASKKMLQSKALNAYALARSPRGNIFVATAGGIRQINASALLHDSIELTALPPVYHAASRLGATNLFFDRQDNLWTGASTGLVKIDTAGNTKMYTEENGLPVNIINSVFQDKENTLWFTNEQTGICKLTSSNLALYKDFQKGFFPTDIFAGKHSDSLWLLDAGSSRLLLKDSIHTKIFQLQGQLSNAPVRSFATDGYNSYMADLFNLYRCNFTKNNQLQLTKLYADSNRNENGSFNYLRPDNDGNLLAVTRNLTAVLKNGQVIVYPLGYYADAFSLTANNYLWVITRGGKLFAFRIHPDDPAHYFELLKIYGHELPVMAPRSIAASDNGKVWIGTRDAGLYCLSFDGGLALRSIENITTHEGLSDNFISYLELDQRQTLWACSPAGFDKLQLQQGKMQIQNITLGNNIYQHIFKTQSTRDGNRWLLATGELIKLSAEQSVASKFQPEILFRQISQDGNYIDPAGKQNSFGYQHNNFSVVVAVPGFINEKETRFSYLLEAGGQKTWSNPTAQSVINLINLPPGKYTLKVRSSFITHRYSPTEIAYSFIIHPPWWQTWWFITVMVLLAGLTVFLVIRNYYRQRFKEAQAIFENEQAIEKERTRIATDMHDDLGAGLSTIRFLSEKVKKNSVSTATESDIDKIQYHSNELIDKMNEIIWSMNEKNNSLEDLVFFLRSYAMQYCGDNNLLCTINVPAEVPGLVVTGETRRNVFLTVKESLHNIVKHAQAENVQVSINISDDLIIIIKDNGKGLPANWKAARGNGCKSMHKRMEGVGGSWQLSGDGEGTSTTIQAPLTVRV